ncbi:hypothetical protein Pla108_00590 [Botrimarina colliarenosi]|uniref:Secreted protein n=1 Tax=Botrimarina colliarenosi TaxID=2528001 RepID=A0A5C6AIA5_9BACT|nr:hypothetical protein [Botrimarina colliarenosi]TWT99126.1 hypothetical protein Pla108_00590 [Botrimarina colliarenosi]
MRMTIGLSMALAMMLASPTLAQLTSSPKPAGEINQANDALNRSTDAAQQSADNASNAASDAADRATEASSDLKSNAEEQSADVAEAADRNVQEASDNAQNEAQGASDSVESQAQEASTKSNSDNEDASNNTDRDEDSRNAEDNRVTSDAGDQSFGNVSQDQLNASWRFVERDGAWWYRTPTNAWMVRQNGEWRPYRYTTGYRGATPAVYDGGYDTSGSQSGANQSYNGQQQAAWQEQGTANSQYGAQPVQYQQPRYGQTSQQGAVGTKEWMCIDGRMRLVTVVAVSSSNSSDSQPSYEPAPAAPESAASREGSDQSANEQDRVANRSQQLTPPPIPQPSDSQDQRASDRPEAPSKEQMRQGAYGDNSGEASSKSNDEE